jgi:hypothetical protein
MVCRACGGAAFIYGEKKCMCKNCRVVMPKPKGGYYDAEGNRMRFTVYQCSCEKLFTKAKDKELHCPKCGALEGFKVVKKW